VHRLTLYHEPAQ